MGRHAMALLAIIDAAGLGESSMAPSIDSRHPVGQADSNHEQSRTPDSGRVETTHRHLDPAN